MQAEQQSLVEKALGVKFQNAILVVVHFKQVLEKELCLNPQMIRHRRHRMRVQEFLPIQGTDPRNEFLLSVASDGLMEIFSREMCNPRSIITVRFVASLVVAFQRFVGSFSIEREEKVVRCPLSS